MIQDIYPKIFNNQYIVKEVKDNDFIIQFDQDKIILNLDKSFITYNQIENNDINLYYLFSYLNVQTLSTHNPSFT